MIGIPVRAFNGLYNCAVVIQNGNILGVVPKEYLPNYQEFYEKRWFASSRDLPGDTVTLCGQEVPFGRLLFRLGEVVMGVEICEDLWVPVPPSSQMALAGANLIVNLSGQQRAGGKEHLSQGTDRRTKRSVYLRVCVCFSRDRRVYHGSGIFGGLYHCGKRVDFGGRRTVFPDRILCDSLSGHRASILRAAKRRQLPGQRSCLSPQLSG